MFSISAPKQGFLLSLLLFIFIFCNSSHAQSRKTITINAKFKMEGNGNYSDAYMVLQRDGVTVETLPGQSSYRLNLEIGADYILSFSKPGYITKKINFNTVVDDDERIDQGFESYPFTVVLMKQYEGVNIVIFNQPVGKITYSKKYDDFDYDTDYTKTIQSAIDKAEAELKKAEQEQKKNPPKPAADSTLVKKEPKPQEVKPKPVEPPVVKNDRKENSNVAADNKEAGTKPTSEKKSTKEISGSKESKKAAGREGQDSLKEAMGSSGEDMPPKNVGGSGGEDDFKNADMKAGTDAIKPKIGLSKGEDKPIPEPRKVEKPIPKKEEPIAEVKVKHPELPASVAIPENVTITRDEISEDKRTIYHIWVTKGDKTVQYSKVVYSWGGVFYFRDMKISISENMYRLANQGKVSF